MLPILLIDAHGLRWRPPQLDAHWAGMGRSSSSLVLRGPIGVTRRAYAGSDDVGTGASATAPMEADR